MHIIIMTVHTSFYMIFSRQYRSGCQTVINPAEKDWNELTENKSFIFFPVSCSYHVLNEFYMVS